MDISLKDDVTVILLLLVSSMISAIICFCFFYLCVELVYILAIDTEDVDLRPVRQPYAIVDVIPQFRTMNLATGLDLPPKVWNGAYPDPTLFLYILFQGSDPDPVQKLAIGQHARFRIRNSGCKPLMAMVYTKFMYETTNHYRTIQPSYMVSDRRTT